MLAVSAGSKGGIGGPGEKSAAPVMSMPLWPIVRAFNSARVVGTAEPGGNELDWFFANLAKNSLPDRDPNEAVN